MLQVVTAYGAVPFPMMHGSCLPDALSSCSDTLPWKPLSGCPEAGDGRCYIQWATLKGFEGQRLTRSESWPLSRVLFSCWHFIKIIVSCFCFFSSSLAPGTKPATALHDLHSGEDVLLSYLRSFYPATQQWVLMLKTVFNSLPPVTRWYSWVTLFFLIFPQCCATGVSPQ